jgi:hypothetical protein
VIALWQLLLKMSPPATCSARSRGRDAARVVVARQQVDNNSELLAVAPADAIHADQHADDRTALTFPSWLALTPGGA